MQTNDFNTGWTVCRLGGDQSARPVALPHDAMLAEPRGADAPGGTNTGWFEAHDYLYEKTFTAPTDWADKAIVLEFEGVYRNAEVLLNGQIIASRPYGYIGFYVALKHLNLGGDNTIQVIARNADQPNSRWYSGAGIYRPVWLHVLPTEHLPLDGVKIRTISISPPAIEIKLDGAPSRAAIQILDGKTVLATAQGSEATIPLPSAALWSPENPKLYTCRISLEDDVREVPFGIRTISCDARRGFCLNGKRVILRGACIHHDNGLLGAVAHPFAEERKVHLLKDAGYNAIRSAHNPCSKALLDACDRLGMLVMDEYADMWYIHKTQYDYAGYLSDWWQRDLADLVNRDYNHPSIIMYCIGNEVSETAQARGIALCKEMADFIHDRDDRPVTCGINIFFNFLSSMGLGVYSDERAKKEAQKAGQSIESRGKKKAVGSEFFNNLAGLLGSKFMKWGATLHGSDMKTRDAFAKLDVAGYNYGINRYEKDLRNYPDRVIVGSETFCADAYHFWELAKGNPALIGDFVWVGMDYLGEVGLGAWEYRDYAPDFGHGPGWLTAGSGRLDITGNPSGEAAYTQVAFELSPIRIGVVPAGHAFEKHSPSAWRMTNTFESWSWNGCEGKETKVEVYARGAQIALFLNGKKVGVQKPKRDCRVSFRVAWAHGTLTAIACGADGKELCRTSLHSAGKETRLALLPERETTDTDGLCYVRLQYTDDAGTVKPLARGDIKVAVQGGTLLGLGNGCPYNERGYLTDTTDTYYGEALAIIRPDGPGMVTVLAESKFGHAQAEIRCETGVKSCMI